MIIHDGALCVAVLVHLLQPVKDQGKPCIGGWMRHFLGVVPLRLASPNCGLLIRE